MRVDGCVRGANGCYVAAPDAATWHPGTRTFSVVVAAVERRRGDVGCTQALVDLGYELAARLPDSPARVRVVHDDVDGRRTVAREP